MDSKYQFHNKIKILLFNHHEKLTVSNWLEMINDPDYVWLVGVFLEK